MNEDGKIILSNGAVVLKAQLRFDQPGTRPHGKALCEWYRLGDQKHEYVVWTIFFAKEDGQWHAESGSYFADESAARQRYEEVTRYV